MQLSKNIQIGLVIFLEIAMCGLFWFYVYTPKTAEIVRLEAEVDRMRREKREIELTKKELAETLKENERLRTEIEHLERFFPEELYIPTVLLQIEHLALATKLTISKISPKGTAVQRTDAEAGAPGAPAPVPGAVSGQESAQYSFDPNREYKKSIIDFDVTGTFQAILNFFSELTTFPKLVVVEELAISQQGSAPTAEQKGGAAPSGGELKVTMPLTFYIQQKKSPLVLEGAESAGKDKKGLLQKRTFDETKSAF